MSLDDSADLRFGLRTSQFDNPLELVDDEADRLIPWLCFGESFEPVQCFDQESNVLMSLLRNSV